MPPQSPSEEGAFAPTWNIDSDASTSELEEHESESQCYKPSVKFSSQVEICPILHRRDMSEEEISKTWMTRYDVKESRQVVNNTVFLMKTGAGKHLTEEDYFCSRGLEHIVDECRAERIKKSLKIALAMQRVLRRNGARSPEMIARAYKAYTFKSQRAAYRKALCDRAAVAR